MLCFDSNFTTYGQKQFEPGVRQQYATVITTLTPIVNTKNFLNGNKHQGIRGLQIKKKNRLAFPVTEPGTNHKKRVGCRFTMEPTQCCAVRQLQLSAPNKCTGNPKLVLCIPPQYKSRNSYQRSLFQSHCFDVVRNEQPNGKVILCSLIEKHQLEVNLRAIAIWVSFSASKNAAD